MIIFSGWMDVNALALLWFDNAGVLNDDEKEAENMDVGGFVKSWRLFSNLNSPLFHKVILNHKYKKFVNVIIL